MKLENVKVMAAYPVVEGVSAAGKPWKSQLFLVQTQEQYPRNIAVEVYGAKVGEIAPEIDSVVTFNVDIESRESKTKPGSFFTTVRAWSMENAGQRLAAEPVQPTQAASVPLPQQQTPQPAPQPQPSSLGENSGLPF